MGFGNLPLETRLAIFTFATDLSRRDYYDKRFQEVAALHSAPTLFGDSNRPGLWSFRHPAQGSRFLYWITDPAQTSELTGRRYFCHGWWSAANTNNQFYRGEDIGSFWY